MKASEDFYKSYDQLSHSLGNLLCLLLDDPKYVDRAKKIREEYKQSRSDYQWMKAVDGEDTYGR